MPPPLYVCSLMLPPVSFSLCFCLLFPSFPWDPPSSLPGTLSATRCPLPPPTLHLIPTRHVLQYKPSTTLLHTISSTYFSVAPCTADEVSRLRGRHDALRGNRSARSRSLPLMGGDHRRRSVETGT
ncbi:hypothetical protein B0H14DRAFT_2794673 [Mycena olivaceomarginata]|nr:hypothetical protein B0H14DRAFT_2794673 [Mycena olivaceomarginata]